MRPAKSLPHRIFRRVLLWIALLASVALAVRWTGLADRAFFFPGHDTPPPPDGAEEVRFSNQAGEKLHGWLLKPRGVSGPPVVLHCHGNAGTIGDHLVFSEFLVDHGFAVLLFDYRGYGLSDDVRISRTSIVEDASAALDYVLTRPDLDTTRVGALGVSLGGVPASHVAEARPEIRCVALVAPFASWSAVASDHLPVAGTLLVRRGYDPIDAIEKLTTKPLVLIHGDRDAVVPPAHSERLSRRAVAAGVSSQVRMIIGAGHNDVMDVPAAQSALIEFFRASLQIP